MKLAYHTKTLRQAESEPEHHVGYFLAFRLAKATINAIIHSPCRSICRSHEKSTTNTRYTKMSDINVNDFKTNEKDTGSTGFQVAVLTKRIAHLTQHLIANKHDHASRRGLLMMVARRRKLLDYAKRTNPDLYKDLLVRLSLRH